MRGISLVILGGQKMEEPVIFWEIVEVVRQMSLGEKVRLLEELNSEIEWELRAKQYVPGTLERDSHNNPKPRSRHEIPVDAWRTFTYEEWN